MSRNHLPLAVPSFVLAVAAMLLLSDHDVAPRAPAMTQLLGSRAAVQSMPDCVLPSASSCSQYVCKVV